MIHLSISLSSQPGCVRDHNEDMLLVCTETYRDTETIREIDIDDTDAVVFAVADGLGGHNAGEVASADATNELGSHVAALPRVLTPQELRENMEQWLQDEHAYFIEQGIANPEQQGMGTTLVGVLCYRNAFYAFNCGDSRLYHFHDGTLTQLSRDHSLYALTHRDSDQHRITNCIGAGPEAYMDFANINSLIHDGDILLLCSDGLTDMLDDAMLEFMLSNDATASDLVQAAYDAGGKDNVSVIIAKITKYVINQ
ncbi:MAG: serine/threonine-protein phosphatase [Bacteroidaceae bacterium]|nr:serine/threonine-protein phosphatase [Bacteroidaceae bacterium]